MALGEADARTIALWIIFAHAHDAWMHSPILSLQSAEKRCGKSTLLSLIAELVPKPLPASNVTTPVLFRSIEAFEPTLLLDETETFIRDNEEMRGVLNSGFTKSMAVTLRLVGEAHEPKPFKTWCPKVMALIGQLPNTLQDRSIVLTLRRKTSAETVERFRPSAKAHLHELRAQAARWASDHFDDVQFADPVMPSGLNDRGEDSWRPLFAISDAVGGLWPEWARRLPFEITGTAGGDDDDSAGTMFLAHVRDVFNERNVDALSSSELVFALNDNEDWPWGEWYRGKPLSSRGLARLAKRFGIRSRRTAAARLYDRASFGDAWNRYLDPAPLQALQLSSSVTAHEKTKQSNTLASVDDTRASVIVTDGMTHRSIDLDSDFNEMTDGDTWNGNVWRSGRVTSNGEVF